MGLLSKLGIAGAVGGGSAPSQTQEKFLVHLTETDLLDTDPVIPTTQWTRIGGYTIPAQQLVHWGYGDVEHPDSMGYLYVYLETDAPGEFAGAKVRLVQANAQGTTRFVIAEHIGAAIHGSRTNRAMQIPLPEQVQYPLVGEDSVVYLELYTTTGDTMDTSDCVIQVPITVYQ